MSGFLLEGRMNISRSRSIYDTEVNQVARISELTGGGYQIMATGTEIALINNALSEAERVSRFGMEVLDDVDTSRDSPPAQNSRLRREIEALAMREASLRSLQKTMSEIDRGGTTHNADLDELSSGAATIAAMPASRNEAR
jgi:hypothetical protein